jgi:hypothetical protein
MSAPHQPRKRAAFESPARLARPLAHDPAMARPASTVAGAVLVLLRVLAGVVWFAAFAVDWPRLARQADVQIEGIALTPQEIGWGLGFVGIGVGVFLLIDAVLAFLILGGRNTPRVIVMLFSTVSISTSFVAWWVQGQDIRVETTLLTLALDILVLLALSSRSAAAYARRHERG